MIDYQDFLSTYPWIAEKGRDCILSPDSDGLLCGLLMTHLFDWKVRGFYDGKILCADKNVNIKECVFLDMEILRENVRSVGQHMILYKKNDVPDAWKNLNHCVSINNVRGYDFNSHFMEKYPFGTIHFLLAVLGNVIPIHIHKEAIATLLFTDGTFKNQFNYPENCLSWLDFLGAKNKDNPLHSVFLNPHYATYDLMVALREFFDRIKEIGGGSRGGDKIKISDSKGNTSNITEEGALIQETREQAERFLGFLSQKTGWLYNADQWQWGNYQVYSFKKGSVKPGKARFNDLILKSPISLAIISRNDIEFTLDPNKVFD